jgi:hypothetical protein
MDETIGQIDRRACRFTGGAEGIPFGAAENLEDQRAPSCTAPVLRSMPLASSACRKVGGGWF